jgi:hypothetical protein
MISDRNFIFPKNVLGCFWTTQGGRRASETTSEGLQRLPDRSRCGWRLHTRPVCRVAAVSNISWNTENGEKHEKWWKSWKMLISDQKIIFPKNVQGSRRYFSHWGSGSRRYRPPGVVSDAVRLSWVVQKQPGRFFGKMFSGPKSWFSSFVEVFWGFRSFGLTQPQPMKITQYGGEERLPHQRRSDRSQNDR